MIEKIIIKVGKKKIELTLEEARILRGELDSISPQFQYIPYYPPTPTTEDPFIYKPVITCESNGN